MMLKRLILSFFIALLASPFAMATEDFSQMLPTVKVVSYKKLFIDQVTAYGSGSGTVVTPDGVVITNHHVIFDEDEFKPLDTFEICVTFDVSKEPVCKYTARLIAHDKDMDIALLKINEKDIFGSELPDLNYLTYQNPAAPREKTRIQVMGYPGSGGETVTITQGQISGFEEFNDYQYFKTDTDFDHGSSGGTALDEAGNYIGIPTYIRSYAENVGFFLDLREAQNWIASNISMNPSLDRDAELFLKRELKRFKRANDSLAYTMDRYPFLSVTLPDGWEFLEINEDSFFASQKNHSRPVGLSVFMSRFQFPINEGYLDKLNEELERIKETYPDYRRVDTEFAGEKAWKITYTSISNKNTTYYIPYGHVLVGISYSIDLDEEDRQEAAIEPVLDSFLFTKRAQSNPGLSETLSFDEPAFEISTFNDWRIQKNDSKQPMGLLAEAVQKDNFEGSFYVSYEQVPKDERHLTAEERLDERIDMLGGRKLVYKNDEVVLGGLKGFLYTFEYEGQKYQEIRKHFVMMVRDGDYEFTFEYDDLTEDFDANLPTVKKILDSFKFKGGDTDLKQITSYGNLGHTFTDIQFHRYAAAIGDLAEKGIVNSYKDGSFKPEDKVRRIDALQMILDSKNHLEKEKGLGKDVDFESYVFKGASLRDIPKKDPSSAYVHYALENDILSGYRDRTFRPKQSIRLGEAMKIILQTYEIPVWEGNTNPWYKKYMDKGFELRLIPYGFYDPGMELTRAELAELVSTVYRHAKN